MPFFSIIIPTYNRAAAVVNAVKSVLSQTFSDLEILVMDDGSTDETKAALMELNDPRIIYEWKENSGGPARPRNRGMHIAKGEWICFLDADDSWAKGKLERCFAEITEKADFIYHDLFIVNNQKTLLGLKKIKSRQVQSPVLKDLLIKGNTISTSSVLVRKHVIAKAGGFNETKDMIATEDFNMWLRIAENTDKFRHMPMALGYYTCDGTGISSKNMSVAYENAITDFLKYLSGNERNMAIAHCAYMNGRYSYMHKRYDQAKKDLFFSFRYGIAKIKIKSIFMLLSLKLLGKK